MQNLNEVEIVRHQASPEKYPYTRPEQTRVLSAPVNVYFDYLPKRLCDHIEEADATVGCVAWLTHFGILDALSHHPTSIVVQKEDFLRPDISARGNWTARLRQAYDRLQGGMNRYALFSYLLDKLSFTWAFDFEPVRCVGNYNAEKKPAFPRSHHKFLVFLRADEMPEDGWDYHTQTYSPYAVWTGSFNFTDNAASSFENAVYIEDDEIAQAYLEEFIHVFALSESLDWTSHWIAPEHRIGT